MSNKGRLDFLDVLLSAQDEDGSGLTDTEIRNEVDTFLFTGNNLSSCRLLIFSLNGVTGYSKSYILLYRSLVTDQKPTN